MKPLPKRISAKENTPCVCVQLSRASSTRACTFVHDDLLRLDNAQFSAATQSQDCLIGNDGWHVKRDIQF